MSRFDVYARPGRDRAGYVLDVQADVLDDLPTRVVVPLVSPTAAPKPARDLNPTFAIEGRPYLMLTQFIATVPRRDLDKPITSLGTRRDEIMRALDLLLVGF